MATEISMKVKKDFQDELYGEIVIRFDLTFIAYDRILHYKDIEHEIVFGYIPPEEEGYFIVAAFAMVVPEILLAIEKRGFHLHRLGLVSTN